MVSRDLAYEVSQNLMLASSSIKAIMHTLSVNASMDPYFFDYEVCRLRHLIFAASPLLDEFYSWG